MTKRTRHIFTCLSIFAFLSMSLASATTETTIGIADFTVEPGDMVTAPILITDAKNLGGCEVTITFDSSVLHATDVMVGDMELLAHNIDNDSMRVYVNAVSASGQSGNLTLAYVNLTAVGISGDTSQLYIEVGKIFATDYSETQYTLRNGSFTVQSQSGVATISIGDAIDNETIPIVIENGVNVGTCDITLSFNASVVNVTNVAGGDFDKTIPNFVYVREGLVRIGAFQTDNPGLNGRIILANVTFASTGSPTGAKSPLNLSVTTFKETTLVGADMPYIVMNGTYTTATNGDVNDDGKVDLHDATCLAKHVLGIPGFENIIEGAADVDGSGVIDVADAIYLTKHVLGVPGYEELG